MSRVNEKGDSSLVNAVSRMVRLVAEPLSARASSSSTATADALSSAPGEPETES
jgi:hypothetical protein